MLKSSAAAIAICVTLAATTANATTSLICAETDLGAGLRGYTFSILETDGQLAPYALSIGWQGLGDATIRQITYLGAPVDDETDAAAFDGLGGYSMAGDSWFYQPFSVTAIPGFDPFGAGIIEGVVEGPNRYAISAVTGESSAFGDGALVAWIVVDGDVEWVGSISRDGVDYVVHGGTALPGDANLDGLVDSQDFTVLKANYGADPALWADGNFTTDTMVDSQDFTILKANFGVSGTAVANSNVVPEPGSALLVLAGLPWLLRRRRNPAGF